MPFTEFVFGDAKASMTQSLTSRYTQFHGRERIHHIKGLFPKKSLVRGGGDVGEEAPQSE